MGQAAFDDPPVVLPVEDEPLVRLTASDELEAANADVATAVLEARSDEVNRRWPHVRLLIASGRRARGPTRSRITGTSCRSLITVPPSCGTSRT
jgi:hypothetical protein